MPPLSLDDLLLPFHEAMKPRDKWRVGAEAEKVGIDARTLGVVPYEGDRGIVGVLTEFEKRFGWKPVREQEGGPIIALEKNHASVTLEPGGQLELSGAPLETMHEIAAETRAHVAELHQICEAKELAWLGIGFHPFARQADLPWIPKLRYSIMREYLPTRGARALDMMRRTATVQANFDYASEDDAMQKLRLGLRVSPIITAMFANSPFFERRISGDLSERAKVWLAVDPDRQGLLPAMWSPESGFRDYVKWALDVPMFLFKRAGKVVKNTGQTFRAFMTDGFEGHRADLHDWELHLNTLFPEVRLKRIIEVRGSDSLPERYAIALPALFTGLFYDAAALDQASDLTRDFTYDEMSALRPAIAVHGPRAPLRGKPVAEVAARLLEIARGGLVRRGKMAGGVDESVHLDEIAKLVAAEKCPADELLAGIASEGPALEAEIVRRARL